ncbi:hypothetical protein DY000_02021881 [Brassica cretica]|uniref:Uncharacterized protein n=1 Tax=Brassica cretica TaxID=69181 RepID=A0ABQ7E9Q7_BRACR|nr:hypothetical protein DY000_02021881 [Brassica cretica]
MPRMVYSSETAAAFDMPLCAIDEISRHRDKTLSFLAVQVISLFTSCYQFSDMAKRRLHSTQLWRAGVQRQTVLTTQRMYIYIRMRRCGVYGLAIHYKKIARILREKIVGISSEYRYSDDIPTKQVVENNSSEFLLSSEIPRNFPTEFRGNKLPRKFRGSLVCRKCPWNIPRENFVGIFPRTFID